MAIYLVYIYKEIIVLEKKLLLQWFIESFQHDKRGTKLSIMDCLLMGKRSRPWVGFSLIWHNCVLIRSSVRNTHFVMGYVGLSWNISVTLSSNPCRQQMNLIFLFVNPAILMSKMIYEYEISLIYRHSCIETLNLPTPVLPKIITKEPLLSYFFTDTKDFNKG